MKSIKSRMLLTSLVVLVAFMVLTVVALRHALDQRMIEAEKDKLQSLMYSILAAVDRDTTGLSITVSDARIFERALFNSGSGLYAFLYDKNGEIWHSPSRQEHFDQVADLADEEMRFSRVEQHGTVWFQQAFSIRWPNVHDQLSRYELVIWKSSDEYIAQYKRFSQTLWLWLVITIVLLLLIMWLVMLWGLRPLRLIGEEVQAIESHQKQRFDGSYPSEIKPLTQNLNLLLQREQHQMQRYRNALDDLAHSLKTPLAVLRGLTEKNTQWTDEDRRTLQEQNDRMNQIVSYQLQKAVTLGGDLMTQPVHLGHLLEKTVNALRKVYLGKALSIDLRSNLTAFVRMDESDLLEVLGNLIDNACKYGRQKVLIQALQQQEHIQLMIEDDGNGLEAAQLEKILTRGMRLDQTQEGQGIGLAVVNEIVSAYAIPMKFDPSTLGGLRVTLTFEIAETAL